MYIFTFPQKYVKDMTEIELSKSIDYLKIKHPRLSKWFSDKNANYIENYTHRIDIGNGYYMDNEHVHYHSFTKVLNEHFLLKGNFVYDIIYNPLNDTWLTIYDNQVCSLSIEKNYPKFRNAIRYVEFKALSFGIYYLYKHDLIIKDIVTHFLRLHDVQYHHIL